MPNITTPAIPSSGVSIPNTTGWYIDVGLAGGTVSNVTVTTALGASATVATSSPCNFAVPPGGSYVITYSAAPTGMQWTDPLELGYTPTYSAENVGLFSAVASFPYTVHEEGGEPGLGMGASN